MNNKLGKVLRVVAIVFMGLTAVFNITGGAGTSCAAFNTKEYPSYFVLIQQNLQLVWQLFVVLTILIGIAGVWAVVLLIRGKSNAYRTSIIVLVIGTIVNGIHVYASYSVLEGIMPIMMVFLTNLITLVLFLILGLPGLRERVNFNKSNDSSDNELAASATAIATGIVIITTAIWAGPSHIYQDENWVHIFQVPLNVTGTLLILGGLGLAYRVFLKMSPPKIPTVGFEIIEGEGVSALGDR